MKKVFFISIVSVLSFFCSNAYAQFYDDDDEIYFYQDVDRNNNAYVFNFNGRKATSFGSNTTLYIKARLKENRNYYEGQVYEVKYDIKYRDDLSSSSWIVYSRYSQGMYGLPSWTDFWYFSKDRKRMIHKISGGYSDSHEFNYRLVEKDYYVDEGRRRQDTNNGVSYE